MPESASPGSSQPQQPLKSLLPWRRLFFATLGMISGALILFDTGQIQELVLRADPTLQGSFSLLHLRPFVSVLGHLCLVLLSMYMVFAGKPLPAVARGASRVCYGALGIELFSLAPCLLATDALCGIFYSLVNQVAAPIMVMAFAMFIFRAGSQRLIRVTAAAAVLLAAGTILAYWKVTPKSALECNSIVDELKRGTCIMNFALRDSDEVLCEQIKFDSSRWSCLYEIAERKGMPALCEQITLPCRFESPGLQCDVETYRDTCYLVVARKLKDEILCEHVTDTVKQTGCREQAAVR